MSAAADCLANQAPAHRQSEMQPSFLRDLFRDDYDFSVLIFCVEATLPVHVHPDNVPS